MLEKLTKLDQLANLHSGPQVKQLKVATWFCSLICSHFYIWILEHFRQQHFSVLSVFLFSLFSWCELIFSTCQVVKHLKDYVKLGLNISRQAAKIIPQISKKCRKKNDEFKCDHNFSFEIACGWWDHHQCNTQSVRYDATSGFLSSTWIDHRRCVFLWVSNAFLETWKPSHICCRHEIHQWYGLLQHSWLIF